MYQFTTETIINSNLDSAGLTAKFSGATGLFNVTRVNRFKTANVLDTKVYKRAYLAPIKAETTAAIPSVSTGDQLRLHVEITLSHNAEAEYARLSNVHMGKPIYVEGEQNGITVEVALQYL